MKNINLALILAGTLGVTTVVTGYADSSDSISLSSGHYIPAAGAVHPPRRY